MLVLSVHGNAELGLDQRIDQLYLFLACVSGYVYILEYDIYSLLKE